MREIGRKTISERKADLRTSADCFPCWVGYETLRGRFLRGCSFKTLGAPNRDCGGIEKDFVVKFKA